MMEPRVLTEKTEEICCGELEVGSFDLSGWKD